MPLGRPTKYTPELLDKAKTYLDSYEENGDLVPTVVGLALFLDIDKTTCYAWAKDEEKIDFSHILRRVENKQEQMLVFGGLSGDYNPAITKMMMTKHGYSDKQEIEQKTFNVTISDDDANL